MMLPMSHQHDPEYVQQALQIAPLILIFRIFERIHQFQHHLNCTKNGGQHAGHGGHERIH